MTNEQKTIRDWAVNAVADQKLSRAISRDVKDAFAMNTKKKAWLTFLYQLGEHKNLPNAVQSIDVLDRVKTETLQSCWVCGTPHNDTYHANFKGKDVFIGNVCAKNSLAKYGLNTGVLTEADKKSAIAKAEEVSNDLDALVCEEPRIVTLAAHTPAKKNENYIGSQVAWVLNQKRVPKKVLEAANLIHDSFSRPGRTAVKTLLDYVEKARKFPTEAYAPIAKDLEMMGRGDLAQKLMAAKELTGLKAKEIWTQAGIDPTKYRIEKNTEFLKHYEPDGKSLATMLEEIIPAVEHDKQLWRDDLLAQEYCFNKVLSPDDYRLVSKCLKRWAFGSTQHLNGADRLRLRNIALRIEPVADFGKAIDGLVAIGRKLEYAKDHKHSDEQKMLERIRDEISQLPNSQKYKKVREMASAVSKQINDPCRLLQTSCTTVEAFERGNAGMLAKYFNGLQDLIETVDRSYALGDNIWARNHPKVEAVKEHVKYGIITKDDVKVLQVLERRVKNYASINSMYLKQHIRDLQEAADSKLAVEMPLGKDKAVFKNANHLDQWAARTLLAQVRPDTASREKMAVARIAAQDYFALKSKLYQNQLTEDQVLEMKAQLKGVPEEQLMSGRQFRYICPLKVKELCAVRTAP